MALLFGRRSALHPTIILIFLVSLVGSLPAVADERLPGASPLDRGNGRIVLVGDSITGLSRNYAAGFTHQMEWALKATYADCHPELIALGGSGQGVTSWLGTEKRARTAEFFLDVKGIPVQASLDRPADVLIVMLGMNDVLAPYVADTPESLDRWTAGYRELVTTLSNRLHPRLIGLATVTMDTEDPTSPKNAMIGKLNGRVKGLADERLAGLLRRTAGDGPNLSYELTPLDGPLSSDRHSFHLHYWWTANTGQPAGTVRVQLRGPGWEVKPAAVEGSEGEFVVTGNPERSENTLSLDGSDPQGTISRTVRISPPWLVATGLVQPFWSGMKFNATNAVVPFDETILHGEDATAASDAQPGQHLRYSRYYPSINYTGLDAAGSLDFSAILHAQNFEAGYATRWVHSPRERPVRLLLGTRVFAGALYLTVFLNGKELYRGQITDEPGKQKQLDARLREGWNALVVKANHCTWQWQFVADIVPAGDLRYSTVPQH